MAIRSRKWRIAARLTLGAAGLLTVGLAGLAGYSHWRIGQPVNPPLPAIAADMSPKGLERGAAIFYSDCVECHRSPGQTRASGGRLNDVPSWLATIESGNLTHDKKTGLDARTDAEIARTVRYAVTHDGRRIFMPDSAMGDADVAAVIGFLRSNDPVLDSVERTPAAPRISLQGEILLTLTGAVSVADYPANGIPVPPKEPTLSYGKYLAQDVFHCASCHTRGFAKDRTYGPDAFAGGGDFTDAEGKPITSPNLTFDATGIKGWSRADLGRAMRDGIRPDGAVLRYPMPRFHALDDVDVSAIYAYLESVPARPLATPRTPPPAPSRAPANGETSPAAAFRSLGCIGCHGEGAIYRGSILAARDKDEEALARWIRNPEKVRPGTTMPTFEAIVDEKAARALAAWIKSGGPASSSTM